MRRLCWGVAHLFSLAIEFETSNQPRLVNAAKWTVDEEYCVKVPARIHAVAEKIEFELNGTDKRTTQRTK